MLHQEVTAGEGQTCLSLFAGSTFWIHRCAEQNGQNLLPDFLWWFCHCVATPSSFSTLPNYYNCCWRMRKSAWHVDCISTMCDQVHLLYCSSLEPSFLYISTSRKKSCIATARPTAHWTTYRMVHVNTSWYLASSHISQKLYSCKTHRNSVGEELQRETL